MNQLTLFNPYITVVITTSSPINKKRLGGQNYRLLKYLCEGNEIHCLHGARKELRIGYLNSRISDLKNKYNINVMRLPVTRKDIEGYDTDVSLYWLEKEEIKRVKEEFEI